MQRSFTDRVLGGVCGGIGRSVWWLRALFALLSVLSVGAVALLYCLLWWIFPQESPMTGRVRGAPSPLLILVIVVAAFGLTGASWAALAGAQWREVYVSGLLVAGSGVFFLRQLRG
jgi:phage shock protein PspC (stress-responsive transcriptional regulator)